MEEIRNCLIVARKEYTNILVDLLYRPIYVGIQSIWEDSKKSAKPREVYRKFQERLLKIPKWNQPVITKEYNRIVDKTKCEYLDELIKKVFVLHTQLLATHSADPNRKIRLSVPKTDDFIHKCYDTCGKSFFENPILMEDRPNVLETRKRIRNLQESTNVIKDCIQTTIRSMLPVGNLLKEDDNDQEGEDISPSPELYQRISAFNDMYKHDTKPTLEALKLPSQTSQAQSSTSIQLPQDRPLSSYPTLSSILKTNSENEDKNDDKQHDKEREDKERNSSDGNYKLENKDNTKYHDGYKSGYKSGYESEQDDRYDKDGYRSDDEHPSRPGSPDKAPSIIPKFRDLTNDNKESIKEIFLGRPFNRTSKFSRFAKKDDADSVDSDSDNERRKDVIANNDLATNFTNNADPIPDRSKELERERDKIDLDVNSATEELPIRTEKQSADDSQQKVPPIENFDAANFFSDNE